MKESFVFYKSYYDAIKKIPEEYQLELYNAILSYSLEGIEQTKLSPIAEAMFILIKPNIDSSQRRYEASVGNGKKGGRPKKETQEKPNNNLEKSKTKPNQNLNVDVDDDVDVNDNVDVDEEVSDSCVDGLPEVIKFYEENIGLITPYTSEILTDFLSEMSKDIVILAIKKAVEANARNIAYIKSILNNWSKKGIKTVIEAQEESQKFKVTNQSKTKEYNDYEQRSYDNYASLYANANIE